MVKTQKDNPKTAKISSLPTKVALYLMLMGSLMGCTLVVANLAAMKIWSLGDWPVDGGIILFPLTYILGDLLVEIYGQKIADRVTDCGFLIGALTCITIAIVAWLPDYAGVDNADFAGIAGLAGRVFIASLVSYWAGQRVNNFVFTKIRRATDAKSFGLRAIGSSLPAHFVDAMIFEPLAFFGRLPFGELLQQIGLAFVAGIALECLLYGITKYLAKRLKQHLQFDDGKPIADYTTPPPERIA